MPKLEEGVAAAFGFLSGGWSSFATLLLLILSGVAFFYTGRSIFKKKSKHENIVRRRTQQVSNFEKSTTIEKKHETSEKAVEAFLKGKGQ